MSDLYVDIIHTDSIVPKSGAFIDISNVSQSLIGVVNASSYGTSGTQAAIQAAIDYLNGSNGTIYLTPDTWIITSNLEIPDNVNLYIEFGALVHINDNITLTVSGPISAGPYRLFTWTNLGEVVLENGQTVYAEWWGAKGDGTTQDTNAFNAAMDALTGGGTIRLLNKTYIVDTLTKWYYGIRMIGESMYSSILKSYSGNTVIELTNLGLTAFEMGNFCIQGNGGSGHGIYVHDNSWAPSDYYIHDMRILNCGGKGYYALEGFTQKLRNIFIDNCGDNAIEGKFNNTSTLENIYVGAVAAGKVGYRIYSSPLMISCNGINSGDYWGEFGLNVADGDSETVYSQPVMINCNVEDFEVIGIKCHSGSAPYMLRVTFLGHGTANLKAMELNNSPNIVPTWQGVNFDYKAGGSWSGGYAVHCVTGGPPCIQLNGNTSVGLTNYYSAGHEVALPNISSKYVVSYVQGIGLNAAQIGGSSNYMKVDDDGNMTFTGTAKITAAITPLSQADASASNNSIYYSTTQSKLVYKDSGGSVHTLY